MIINHSIISFNNNNNSSIIEEALQKYNLQYSFKGSFYYVFIKNEEEARKNIVNLICEFTSINKILKDIKYKKEEERLIIYCE